MNKIVTIAAGVMQAPARPFHVADAKGETAEVAEVAQAPTPTPEELAEMDRAARRKKLAELERIAAGAEWERDGRHLRRKRLTPHGHRLLAALRLERAQSGTGNPHTDAAILAAQARRERRQAKRAKGAARG